MSQLKSNQWVVKSIFTPVLFIVWTSFAVGQVQVSLDNLDFFRDPGQSWSIAGEVAADLNSSALTSSKGKGILVNNPTKKKTGADLYSQSEYGDMDLELEYMMAAGSNSGIYLQGRYEIQLMDSWGVTNPRSGDNGGVYQRWDDSKPEGQKGYEGYAPRQNVSRAPGLWQQLAVSFRAPRFDENGNKTENARIIQMSLNGVVIHENVELFGPTRGGMENNEKETGPLRIQGDHGAVAFRNIRITSFDKSLPELSSLTYEIFGGRFEQEPNFSTLTPESKGSLATLSSRLNPESNQYLIRYKGTLELKEAGEYTFNLNVPGGLGRVTVSGEDALDFGQGYRRGRADLPAGEVPFELLYSKYMDWVKPGLGLAIAGPGIREFQMSSSNSIQRNEADLILVDPKEKPLLRSFMDVPGYGRVTHAISVGSERKVHFTYDLDHGHLVQVWRGEFLDATPMWNNRGDGSSRPLGTVVRFGNPVVAFSSLSSVEDGWAVDTVGTSYKPLGYKINAADDVAFMYKTHGATVTDEISILEDGQGIQREVQIQDAQEGGYFLLAQGEKIEKVNDALYVVNDKEFYLRLDEGATSKAIIRNGAGKQELIVPVTDSLIYSLLF